MKEFFKNKKVISILTIVGVIIVLSFILIGFPIITNFFAVSSPPFSFEVNDENDWIGFFSSYFGAIIGGFIAGIFTYWGVRITINDQNKIRINQLKLDSRPQLQISEIYDAAYDLKNIPEGKKSGRLIITENYRLAESMRLTDASFNIIVIENFSNAVAINCNITTGIRFESNQEVRTQSIFIPIINENDRLFIPVDPVPDRRPYRIIIAKVEFQTLMKEELYVERNYERLGEDYVVSDVHYVKDENGQYQELYKVRGSKAEWKFI